MTTPNPDEGRTAGERNWAGELVEPVMREIVESFFTRGETKYGLLEALGAKCFLEKHTAPTSTVPTERSDNSGEGSGENRAIAEKVLLASPWTYGTEGGKYLLDSITAALDAKDSSFRYIAETVYMKAIREKDAEISSLRECLQANREAYHFKLTQLEADKKALAEKLKGAAEAFEAVIACHEDTLECNCATDSAYVCDYHLPDPKYVDIAREALPRLTPERSDTKEKPE